MYILAIDIGGSFIKYGIFRDKTLVEQGKKESEAAKGYEYLVENVDRLIEVIGESYKVKGIAISTAGIVDVESGQIIHAGPTIPGYKGFNWKKHIKEKYGLPSCVDNDVNCALMGEYSCGFAKNMDKVLMLAIGTGIGGAYLENGKIFRGSNKCALEVGYMLMGPDKFENLASTNALVKNYLEITKIDQANGFEIFTLAKKGDINALKAIDNMIDYLAKGIANISFVLDPKAIVLGGGVMEQEEFLRPIILEKLQKYMLPLTYNNMNLIFAKVGNMAACFGALHNYYLAEE